MKDFPTDSEGNRCSSTTTMHRFGQEDWICRLTKTGKVSAQLHPDVFKSMSALRSMKASSGPRSEPSSESSKVAICVSSVSPQPSSSPSGKPTLSSAPSSGPTSKPSTGPSSSPSTSPRFSAALTPTGDPASL
jgi:hypothetical protein